MSDSLRAVAYHEAGHAVVALLVGMNVHHVVIDEKPETGRLGHAMGDYAGLPRNRASTYYREAMMSFAGVIAEAMHLGGFEPLGDARAAFERGHLEVSGYEQDLAVLDFLKTFQNNPTAHLVDLAIEMLDRYWDRVSAVAGELEKRKSLDADEIIRIVGPRAVHPQKPRKRRKRR